MQLLLIKSVSEVDRTAYLDQLQDALWHFYDSIADLAPKWLANRTKLHLLAHAIPSIQRFSLLKNYEEGPFESHNAPMRNASIFSNRQAPSRDIGQRMGRAEAIRHLISGGFYPHESHQLPHCTEWIEAGTGIRSFMKQSDVFMKLYGLADAHNSRLEDHGPGTTERAVRDPQAEVWYFTGNERYLSGFQLLENSDFGSTPFQQYKSVITRSGDSCKIDEFVSLTESETDIKLSDIQLLDCILRPSHQLSQQPVPLPAHLQSTFLLVDVYKPSGLASAYSMPAFQHKPRGRESTRIMLPKNLHCVVNVIHNCISSKCEIDSQGGHRRQERQEQAITLPAIKHKGFSKVVLNTNLQRSAHLLGSLYGKIKSPPSLQSISRKAARNIEEQVDDGEASGEEGGVDS